jgi:hypothetical protein
MNRGWKRRKNPWTGCREKVKKVYSRSIATGHKRGNRGEESPKPVWSHWLAELKNHRLATTLGVDAYPDNSVAPIASPDVCDLL